MSVHSSVVFEEAVIDGQVVRAKVAEGVSIGPFCVIGPHVSLAAGVKLHSHVVVAGHTRLEEDVEVFPFAVVGGQPQDLKYHGEPGTLRVGARTVVREAATLHIGTDGGGMHTDIGSDCLIMAYAHVAHDCAVGNHVIVASGSMLAGHVSVGDHAIIAGLAGVHQFARIGAHAFVAGGSVVVSDILPFCTAQGDRAQLVGLNREGLRRRGFSPDALSALKKAYRVLFRSGHTLAEALDLLSTVDEPAVAELVAFAKASPRGVARPRT